MQDCLGRSIKRQRLGAVSLAGLLQLLKHYDVRLEPAMAVHLQAMVLNKAVSFISVDKSQVPAVQVVFEHMAWLASKKNGRSLLGNDERLYSVSEMHEDAFIGLGNDELLQAFARLVLVHCPFELYELFLSNVYKSGNARFMAYVIAIPEHYQHMLKYKDSLFPRLLGHLLDIEVKEVASLMLYACIIPLGEVNEEVSAISRQCEEKKVHLLSDTFSASEGTCSSESEGCVWFDRYAVAYYLKRIVAGQ